MNRFLKLFTQLALFTIGALFLLLIAATYYIQFELPDIKALKTVQLQVPLQIYTQDEKLIATFGEKRRIPIPYNEIPKPLIQAILATEDQRYFTHSGVDLPGLGRAAIQLLLTGRKVQGGSTITMQVARSFYLSRHKTFSRKLREILLAIKIEHTLTKEKILELYLNKVFLGNRAYGVGAAAEIYYGKPLHTLSLAQFATLAGLPKAPSTLNPLANPNASIKRRHHVLLRMLEQGYINQAAYETARKAPVTASYHNLPTEINAPYAAEVARNQLEQMYGESIYTDGFKAYTTIDSQTQLNATQAVIDQVIAYDKRHGYRGPEKNLGLPTLTAIEHWDELLSKIPEINGLEPAAVVDIMDNSITVLRANGKLVIIPWSGLKWARKQINADYLGAPPNSAGEIVKPGDVVRIHHTVNGYELAQLPQVEGGLIALRSHDGAILAMVGGFNYQLSKFNVITSAQRQPGSSFKPFIYAAALDKGFTLATVLNDAPIVVENKTDNTYWRPQNDSHRFQGATRLRSAIITSSNLVSIRLLSLIGLPYSIEYLKRFGFDAKQLPNGLSLALGTALVTPLQMAQAFSIFANGGFQTTPFLIKEIRTSADERIYQAKPLVACTDTCPEMIDSAPRVISAETAYLITSTLQDVILKGTGRYAKRLGRSDLAGKTGTSQNQVDAWFAGYNPDLTAIAWMGFNQPQSLHEYSANTALPLWTEFIEKTLKNVPEKPFIQPKDIITVPINPLTGNRVAPDNPNGIPEYFMQDHLPQEETEPEVDIYGSLTSDKNLPIHA